MEVRKHIKFYGRVQGVGFRYHSYYLAQSFNLTGWIRNLWDGSVEMEIQGKDLLINNMLEKLEQGTYIRIEHMDAKDCPLEEDHSFMILEA